MGLFGKKKEKKVCAVCGSEIKGLLTWDAADGRLCDTCHDRFAAMSGDSDTFKYTAADIRERLNGKGSQSASVTNSNNICPGCSNPMTTEVFGIAGGELICQNCERIMRGSYFRTDDEDELKDAELSYVKEDVEIFNKRKAEALAKCPADAASVAYIDEDFPAGEKGSKRVVSVGVFKGFFYRNDEAVLMHGGEEIPVKIKRTVAAAGGDYAYEDEHGDIDGSSIEAGGYGWMVIKDIDKLAPEGLELMDIIYKK